MRTIMALHVDVGKVQTGKTETLTRVVGGCLLWVSNGNEASVSWVDT